MLYVLLIFHVLGASATLVDPNSLLGVDVLMDMHLKSESNSFFEL